MWSDHGQRAVPSSLLKGSLSSSPPADSSHSEPILCCDPACLQLCSLDCTSSCTQDTTTPCTTADCQHDCTDPFCTTYDPCVDDCLSDCSDHCIVDCDDNCSEICTADCIEPSCKEPHCTQSQCSDTPCGSYNSSHDSLDHKMDDNHLQCQFLANVQAMFQAPQQVNSRAMSQANQQSTFQAMPQAYDPAVVQTSHHGFNFNYPGPMSQGPSQAMPQAFNMSMSQDTQQADIPAYNQAVPQAIPQAHDSVEPEAYQPANNLAFGRCGVPGPGGVGICGHVFTSYADSKAHFDAAHKPFLVPSDKKGTAKCPWPNCKEAPQRNQVFRHMVTHDYPKRFSCEVCGQAFNQTQGLNNHMVAQHTDEKPHVCDRCDYATKTKDALQQHIKTQHKGESHWCASCNLAIAGRDNFNHHVAEFHKYGVECPGCSVKNRTEDKMWQHFVCQNAAGVHGCGGLWLDERESFVNWWRKENGAMLRIPWYAAWVAEVEGKSRAKAAKNKERTAGKKRKAPGEEGEEIDNGAASPSKRSRSSSGDADSAATKAKEKNAARKLAKAAGPAMPMQRVRQTLPAVQPQA